MTPSSLSSFVIPFTHSDKPSHPCIIKNSYFPLYRSSFISLQVNSFISIKIPPKYLFFDYHNQIVFSLLYFQNNDILV